MVIVERRNVEQRGQDLVRYVRQVRDVRMVEVHLMVQIAGGRRVVLMVRQVRRDQMMRQLLLQMDRQVVLLLQHQMLLVATADR